MISYTDWVALQYERVANGQVVVDLFAQPVITREAVTLQMVSHNWSALRGLVLDCLDVAGVTSPFIRAGVVDLFKESFYQLAAIHEGELRRTYEAKYYDNKHAH